MAEDNTRKIQELIELHRHFSQRHIVWGERGWETIKINVTINSTLLVATIGIMGVLYKNPPHNYPPKFSYMLLLSSPIIIPILLLWINEITLKNFKRECRRMYRNITILMKIEEKMGLYDERPESRILLKCDKYFIPSEFVICYPTSKEFIDAQMETEDRAFKMLSRLFCAFNVISIVLIVLIIFLVILSLSPFL